jgi:predicted phosphodiesterase
VAVLALISDIHGNGVALDAVLADVAAREVDEIVCLGDVAAGGPQPRRVIRRLRELGCRAVRGNADGWLLDGLPAGRSEATRRLRETVAWARGQLGDDDLAYLAVLPATLSCSVGGLELLCVHGPIRCPSTSLP